MKSNNLEYLPSLDHLRLLAATLVFAFHAYHQTVGGWKAHTENPVWGLITEGHTGVSLFFVLSGFLFMTIGLQGEIRYWEFLRNRLLRIFPLFVFFFVVSISMARDAFRPTDIFYLLFSNLGLAPTSNHFITGAAWTISIEFSFYLIFPWLSRFSREQGIGFLLRLLLLIWVVKLASFAATEKSTHMLYSTLIGRFDQFIWGMLAALIWHQHRSLIEQVGRWLLPVAMLAIWAAVAWQANHASFFLSQPKQWAWLWWGSAEAILWALVMVCYVGARLPWSERLDRLLASAGQWSYSLYLWHATVIFLVGEYVGYVAFSSYSIINALLNMLFIFPFALLLAALSFHTIEKPFLSLRKRYL